jgi:hypothetical protein
MMNLGHLASFYTMFMLVVVEMAALQHMEEGMEDARKLDTEGLTILYDTHQNSRSLRRARPLSVPKA